MNNRHTRTENALLHRSASNSTQFAKNPLFATISKAKTCVVENALEMHVLDMAASRGTSIHICSAWRRAIQREKTANTQQRRARHATRERRRWAETGDDIQHNEHEHADEDGAPQSTRGRGHKDEEFGASSICRRNGPHRRRRCTGSRLRPCSADTPDSSTTRWARGCC